MKIIVSQKDLPVQAGKKLLVSFKHDNTVDNYSIDKAEDFLLVLDKFFRRRRISPTGQIGHIEFENTGILTERVIRAIISGLGF